MTEPHSDPKNCKAIQVLHELRRPEEGGDEGPAGGGRRDRAS
jgi:hypothetical protein